MAMATNGSLLGSATSSTQNTLRDRQIASLKRMLNLNVPVVKTSLPGEPVWKVLVYDKFGQDILSPLLTVKELKCLGVTLHLPLDSRREPVYDAVAIYFVTPSHETVSRISRDLHSHLYSAYYFNFITPISRPLLEDLGKAAMSSGCVTQIAKVFDQYSNFISLEEDLFITRYQDKMEISYFAMNRPDSKDCDIARIRDIVVDSLFSVFVSAGVVPIIRCPRGNMAEMVSEQLDKKLRDNLRDPRSSMFTGEGMAANQLSFSRPLLVVFDRSIDLATLLHHTWTYQALCHDVFELELNRLSLSPTSVGVHETQTKSYDLHSRDRFWQTHRGSPFPSVADAVQTEVTEYRAKEEEMTMLKSVMGVSDGDDPAAADSTAKLTSAISSLPELMEKKKTIDMHTNIATELLDHIKTRKLDLFFEMEDKIISRTSLDKSVMDIISDCSAGTVEDKLRLFLIYYLLSPDLSEQDVVQHVEVLQNADADLLAIEYIKRWKAFMKMTSNPRQLKQSWAGASSASMSGMFQHIGSKMMEGVRSFVIRTKDLPVTRLVDQLMEMKTSKETEDFRYLDPKLLKATDSSTVPRSRGPFQEAYVFVVGGGNYIEYQNLRDYCARPQQLPRRITYGTTELMDASEFLAQLSRLGGSSE